MQKLDLLRKGQRQIRGKVSPKAQSQRVGSRRTDQPAKVDFAFDTRLRFSLSTPPLQTHFDLVALIDLVFLAAVVGGFSL